MLDSIGSNKITMNNVTNYPSCIKIPSKNSKQGMVTALSSQKFDIKEALSFNNELISLANQIFGERKWSHTVTNQTIDFVESFMGKYVCGCVTFVKIQLQDGTFHEDMGYCHAEGAMKGLSIHFARIGSLTDAFKKVLSCFGDTVETKIQKLIKKSSQSDKKTDNSHIYNIQKEDFQCSIAGIQSDVFEPCAQSTPFIMCKNSEGKDKPESISRPKSPYDKGGEMLVQQQTKSKNLTEQRGHLIPLKNSIGAKGQLQSNAISHQIEEDNIQEEEDQKKALSDEELLRLERKRKQMEKQAEYKRLMKEKEQQKPNPKY